jgi:aryl-alcohol dehydrogenase-like predicted oxidoreductase
MQEGKVRAFGGSNWSFERLQEANAYAAENGLTPFAVSSPNYSLADQVKEPWSECVTISGPKNAEVRAWYQKTQTPLFTWSSLAGGFFSGRITRDNTATFEDYFNKLAVECYASEDNFKRLDRAKELADAKGYTIPQIALAYVMGQPLNIFALVGCNIGAEYKANADALELKLTDQELAYLDLRT